MEAINAERWAIRRYLDNHAKAIRDHARRLLADTMQARPEAEKHEWAARWLERAAKDISEGAHWK
jgi:hypothetical protein